MTRKATKPTFEKLEQSFSDFYEKNMILIIKSFFSEKNVWEYVWLKKKSNEIMKL